VDGCNLDGVQNLETCQMAPVIASFPHFYLADPVFRDYIQDSITPNKEKHQTYVEIDPVIIRFSSIYFSHKINNLTIQKTGTALRGAKRIQFNMELQPFKAITILSSVSPGLFPIMWIEEVCTYICT
jgi:hypothetical protein